MALIRPPITGDQQLDSWTDQLTKQINQGLVPGSGGGGADRITFTGGGGAPTQGPRGLQGVNGTSTAAVYMYLRSVTRGLGPQSIGDGGTGTGPPDDATFGFVAGTVTPVGTGSLNGWSLNLNDPDFNSPDGEYVWVILQYAADTTGSDTDLLSGNSWSDIRLLAAPAASPISILVESDVGIAFRNIDTGANFITITANVYLGGALQSDIAHNDYQYDWRFLDSTLYVTEPTPGALTGPWSVVAGLTGQPRITAGTGLPATTIQLTGDLSNLRTIRVPDTAVSNMAQITCDISNIPDDAEIVT